MAAIPKHCDARFQAILALAFALLAPWFSSAATAQGEKGSLMATRVALVIGNAAYAAAPLRNPVNDARSIADALSRLGFRVTLLNDADLAGMLDALTRFARETRNDSVRLFFYAGHGLQFRGKNYLVPVDAHIATSEDIPTEAVEIQGLIDHLQRGSRGLNIIILDACRNYSSAGKWAHGTRGVGSALPVPGLAEIEAPRGTVIAFSTAPGAVAKDGASQHSIYAKHLLASLDVPGLTLEQLFKRVRSGVLIDTDQVQTPWENSSLVGDFCFRPGPRGECPSSDSVSSPVASGARR